MGCRWKKSTGASCVRRWWGPPGRSPRSRNICFRCPMWARTRILCGGHSKWLQSLSPEFADRILPVDERVADQWGRLGLLQPVPTLDAFLAATALVHDLTVVSRDEDGVRRTGVRMINPSSKPNPAGN